MIAVVESATPSEVVSFARYTPLVAINVKCSKRAHSIYITRLDLYISLSIAFIQFSPLCVKRPKEIGIQSSVILAHKKTKVKRFFEKSRKKKITLIFGKKMLFQPDVKM